MLDQKVATAPCGVRAENLHPMEWIAAKRATAVPRDRHVQRPHISAGADQPFDNLELMDVCRNEIGLDAMLAKPLEVFEIKGRSGINYHASPGRLHLGIYQGGSP